MQHEMGPIGGIVGPSATPLDIETPPVLFGGDRPKRFFVSPTTSFQQQEDRNSCCAHGFSAPVESVIRAKGRILQVCRADLYSGALFLDGSEGRDVGVTISAMGRHITQKGVLPEYVRPYKTDDVTRRTNTVHDKDRMKGVVAVGLALSVDAILDAILVSGGVPFGQPVRSNYKPDSKGIIAPPSGTLGGYHCTEVEGWDDETGMLLNRESWLNFGIDHPMAADDPKFFHLRGKRGFTWRPYEWVKKDSIFEPVWLKGTLEGVK